MTTDLEVGQRIAALRRQRRLSQKALATELGRSESWMSQVERGVQPVQRVSILHDIANALGVSMQELRPEVATETDSGHDTRVNDLSGLRLALSGHPTLDRLLGQTPTAEPIDFEDLETAVTKVWDAAHASRFSDLSELLTNLIPRIEHAVRAPEASTDHQDLYRIKASLYQAAAAAFARQDEPDAAWVAADRAIAAAEQAGNPLEVGAGHIRLAHAFMRLRRPDQADRVTSNAIASLAPLTRSDDVQPELLSLYGALHLTKANISAKEHDRTGALQQLAEAEATAERLGADRNDFETEFGPTNVRVHAVGIAVDLGDAGRALDIAAHVDPTPLSVERQARFHMDIARAYSQRRQLGESVNALLAAERLAPEQVTAHHLTRTTVAELQAIAGHRASDDLQQLAARVQGA